MFGTPFGAGAKPSFRLAIRELRNSVSCAAVMLQDAVAASDDGEALLGAAWMLLMIPQPWPMSVTW